MANGKFGQYLRRPVTSLFTTITGTAKDSDPLLDADEQWLLVARIKPGKHTHKPTDETDNGDVIAYQLQQVAVVKGHVFVPRKGNTKLFDDLARKIKAHTSEIDGQQTLDGED